MASNAVANIYQDSEGYIWVATLNGLQRYDGYSFVTYRADLRNPDALQTDWISTIFEDSRKRLWIGTDNGAPYLLNRNNGKFYNYNLHVGPNGSPITGVWKFVEDGNADIWLFGKNGYYKLNEADNQFYNYSAAIGIKPGVWPGAFAKDKDGCLWFATGAGLKYYDRKTKKVYNNETNPLKLAIFAIKDKPVTIFIDDGNNLWMSTSTHGLLYRYNISSGKIKTYLFKKPVPEGKKGGILYDIPGYIAKGDNGGIIAVLIERGLALYDPVKDSFSIIKINNEDPYGLHWNESIEGAVNIFTDREGNTWVSGDKGISVFNPSKQHFYYYGPGNNAGALPAYSMGGFLQTPGNGDIYIAYYHNDTKSGIYRLDSNLRVKNHYIFPSANSSYNALLNQIWCLFMDEDGIIWAPNQSRTILKLDVSRNRLVNSTDAALWGIINTIQKDSHGNKWVGHWTKGLLKIDHTTHLTRSFTRGPASLLSPVKNVTCLYVDGDSIIWAGTKTQGLLRFNTTTNEFTDAYRFDENNSGSISSDIVTCLIPYNGDTLILATPNGINIFDKQKRTFSIISGKDGLPGDFVQTIALDKKKNVWAGSVGGFCRVDIHTRSVTSYGISDGILSDVFINQPILSLTDGRFMVASNHGFMVFDPETIRETSPPPDVTITSFKIFDKEVKIDSLIKGKHPVTLSYKNNNIQVEFASLQFDSPDKIKYYYQLEGVDKGWIAAGKEHAARYNQLKSGDYLFRIKCVNRNGIPSDKITQLSIHLIPPFWQTLWFYFLTTSLAVVAIIVILRWVIDKKNLKFNYERKIVAMEMNTLRAQMNPHFIFNSLNSINTFILQNDQDNACDYLNKFSRLIRLILDNSRTEWVLLENELMALQLYVELEGLRLDHAFSYSISIAQDVLSSSVLIPPLIIQPYVENAIWHGLMNRKQPGGQVSVGIRKENNTLIIQIEDNGIGREAAAKLRSKGEQLHKSHGMEITAERLSIVNEAYKINAGVTVTDLPGTTAINPGTMVLLTIQYKIHESHNY